MKWNIKTSHEAQYKTSVIQALNSEESFKTFRSNKTFAEIISDAMPNATKNYICNELIKYPNITSKLNIFRKMDELGSPELVEYNEIKTSPRNLKYMLTTALIQENFPNIKTVVEIGSCYGGLCFTLGNIFSLTGYKLVDIDCVVSLAKLFLSKLPPISNIEQDRFFNPNPPYDICISESALSEMDFELIEHYYQIYLIKSKYLFINTNFHTDSNWKNFINMTEKNFTIKTIYGYDPNDHRESILLGWNNDL